MENNNIYKVCRKIKRKEQNLYNALRSIFEDSLFVSEIRGLWPQLPLVANLRCGLWYSSQFDSTCYFKSTDGHAGNWSFNPSRLNLHICTLAAEKGGCIIVDATRKGKRFPDSMSKTIPIWTCILNRAIHKFRDALKRQNLKETDSLFQERPKGEEQTCSSLASSRISDQDWDCSLHLPLWVSDTERANIEGRIEGWIKILENTGVDLTFISSNLKKPLQPLWLSQRTVIWLNEVPDITSWSFTPIILVSASNSIEKTGRMNDSELSWSYIPGAADDEESWARGLSPNIFWKHAYDLISSEPELCNRMVAHIVEKDRVYRSQRGQHASQIRVKTKKVVAEKESGGDVHDSGLSHDHRVRDAMFNVEENGMMDHGQDNWLSEKVADLYRVGDSGLAICTSQNGHLASSSYQINSIIDCDPASDLSSSGNQTYLHLPVKAYKFDRCALQNCLSPAIAFAGKNLNDGRNLLIMCPNGEDISVCVCLAILISLFDNEGMFDSGETFKNADISKWDVRRKLVYICSFVPIARPSRGHLRQVYNFLRNSSSDD